MGWDIENIVKFILSPNNDGLEVEVNETFRILLNYDKATGCFLFTRNVLRQLFNKQRYFHISLDKDLCQEFQTQLFSIISQAEKLSRNDSCYNLVNNSDGVRFEENNEKFSYKHLITDQRS